MGRRKGEYGRLGHLQTTAVQSENEHLQDPPVDLPPTLSYSGGQSGRVELHRTISRAETDYQASARPIVSLRGGEETPIGRAQNQTEIDGDRR